MTPPEMPAPADEAIAKRLRRLRLARGLSQREMAEPGITFAYISRIEAGTRNPSVKALRQLARKLGVSVAYLESGVDVEPHEEREMRIAEAELRLRLGEGADEALASFEQLLVEARATGDGAIETRARAGIGMAALERGDHVGAIAALEEPIRAGSLSPLTDGELYAVLARAYTSAGRKRDAIELLERALLAVEEAGDLITYLRFASFLSYALSDAGEIDRAREVVEEAVERGRAVDDPYMRVRLYWSQARLAAAAGATRQALRALRQAIALLELTEDTRQLGRAHLLAAEILNGDGRHERAAPHLAQAEQLLAATPEAEDRYWLKVEQARQAAAAEPERALTLVAEALELIGETDPAERGSACAIAAAAHASRGDTTAALRSYEQAVTLLEQAQSWMEAAQVRRAWAQHLEAAGRTTEAAEVLEQAAEALLRARQ
jgi:transcriptional regulator with XRE-family HTH domain